MGTVYADITLKNAGDAIIAGRGIIKKTEVRTAAVKALVDTGAGTLIINEDIRGKLGLTVQGTRGVRLADGSRRDYQVTEPVTVQWKNRDTTCLAVVLPELQEILLGAIPLEDMDLMVDPVRRELCGAHGDEVLCLAYNASAGA